MTNTMKILHVASFSGNIGDEANHQGFRSKFRENVSSDVIFHDLEIRSFYRSWNLRKFDDDFVQEANQYDLVVFGGGNFFEACWDYSATATTIDLSPSILKKLRPPIFFNGVGFDDGKGISEANIGKFGEFLTYLGEHPEKYLTSVRNDGSLRLLQKYYDSNLLRGVHNIPDGGFFFHPKGSFYLEKPADKTIGICLACDMPEIRYGQNIQQFTEQMASFLNKIMKDYGYGVTFYPHIYSDLTIISQVLAKIDDVYRRTLTTVAPLLNARTHGAQTIFDSYRYCDMILGMRFHSNVCAIGNQIPTIGLISYPKHGMLYDELGIPKRRIAVSEPDFEEKLHHCFRNSLNRLESIRTEYREITDTLNQEIDSFHRLLRQWLERCNIL